MLYNQTIRHSTFGLFYAIGLTHLTTYATIRLIMKFNLFRATKVKAVKTISDYKQDVLVKQGGEQFKKLLEKGISIPVVML